MDNKSKFLGMPHGTASHRLRKSILFSLLQRLEEDVCFRCTEKIQSVFELSVEHKLPWENISVDLFWDLSNIAFSHLKCNVPHVRNNGSCVRRKIGIPGTSWCSDCKAFISDSEFYNDSKRWNGKSPRCKSHTAKSRDKAENR